MTARALLPGLPGLGHGGSAVQAKTSRPGSAGPSDSPTIDQLEAIRVGVDHIAESTQATATELPELLSEQKGTRAALEDLKRSFGSGIIGDLLGGGVAGFFTKHAKVILGAIASIVGVGTIAYLLSGKKDKEDATAVEKPDIAPNATKDTPAPKPMSLDQSDGLDSIRQTGGPDLRTARPDDRDSEGLKRASFTSEAANNKIKIHAEKITLKADKLTFDVKSVGTGTPGSSRGGFQNAALTVGGGEGPPGTAGGPAPPGGGQAPGGGGGGITVPPSMQPKLVSLTQSTEGPTTARKTGGDKFGEDLSRVFPASLGQVGDALAGGTPGPTGRPRGYNHSGSSVPVDRATAAGKAEVNAALEQVARETGYPINELRAVANIESSMNPNSNIDKPTQYKGLMQIGREEWAKNAKPGENIYNPLDNARVAARIWKKNDEEFKKKNGRLPTGAERYMMHQQGPGFYPRGEPTNPGGNPYPGMSSSRPSHEEFDRGWTHEFNRQTAEYDKQYPQNDQTATKSPDATPKPVAEASPKPVAEASPKPAADGEYKSMGDKLARDDPLRDVLREQRRDASVEPTPKTEKRVAPEAITPWPVTKASYRPEVTSEKQIENRSETKDRGDVRPMPADAHASLYQNMWNDTAAA